MNSEKSPLVPPLPPPPPYTAAPPQQPAVGAPALPTYGTVGGQANTSNVTVAVSAPRAAHPVPSAPPMVPPKNYLIWSVMTTLFCSVPIGLIAVIFSIKASNAYEAGNYEQALAAARTARILNIVGLVVGIVVFVAVFFSTGVSVAVVSIFT